jgi:hypothetical protein
VEVHPWFFRHVKIDHVTYLRNIQTSCRNICSNQETGFARAESLNGHVSLPLRKVPMDRHCIITISVQRLSQPVAANLCGTEDKTSTYQILLKKAAQYPKLLVLFNLNNLLINSVHRQLIAVNEYRDGVTQVAMAKPDYFVRHSRGEQSRLMALRNLIEYVIYVVDEAHV